MKVFVVFYLWISVKFNICILFLLLTSLIFFLNYLFLKISYVKLKKQHKESIQSTDLLLTIAILGLFILKFIVTYLLFETCRQLGRFWCVGLNEEFQLQREIVIRSSLSCFFAVVVNVNTILSAYCSNSVLQDAVPFTNFDVSRAFKSRWYNKRKGKL